MFFTINVKMRRPCFRDISEKLIDRVPCVVLESLRDAGLSVDAAKDTCSYRILLTCVAICNCCSFEPSKL